VVVRHRRRAQGRRGERGRKRRARGRLVRRHGGGVVGGRGVVGSRRREDLEDLDIPEHPAGVAVRDVVGDGVAPGREPGVGAEEVVVPRAEADGAGAVALRHPLDGGVEAVGQRLRDLAARRAEEERLVGGGEVAAVAAAQAQHAGAVRDRLHLPPRVQGRRVPVLRYAGLVLVRVQVLVVVAPQPHCLGALEQLHRRGLVLVGDAGLTGSAIVRWRKQVGRGRGRRGASRALRPRAVLLF
jgi:hypothetical protein